MSDTTIQKDKIEISSNKISEEGEKDLVELFKLIWSKKWFIAKLTTAFMALGLLIAFTSPVEYKTSSTLIPEASGEDGKLGGSLGGLASLAGVDLGGISGSSGMINPALYQSVSRSTPFLIELMNQKFYFSRIGEEITIYDYYITHYKVSLFSRILSIPGTVISWIKSDSEAEQSTLSSDLHLLSLSRDKQAIIEDLQTRVFVEMDWDLNLVTVQVEMQDPVVSAQMVQFTQDYITNYVTEYAMSKGHVQLMSIENQYEEKKKEFEDTQLRLASFRDKNQNVTTARARSEEERLLSEYNLKFNVYSQLAQQREAIKLKIQKETPVFTILEPVRVPIVKSKPRRTIILIFSVFIGLILSFSYLMVGMLFKGSRD